MKVDTGTPIKRVYVCCGEGYPVPQHLLDTHDKIFKLLRDNGMEPVEQIHGVGHEVLEHIDAALDQTDAMLLYGKLKDPAALYTFFNGPDKGQTRLKGAMYKNPDHSVHTVYDKDGNDFVFQKPIGVIDLSGEQRLFFQRFDYLFRLGSAKAQLVPSEKGRGIIDVYHSPEEAAASLKKADLRKTTLFVPPPLKEGHQMVPGKRATKNLPKCFVCNGFSLKEPYFLATSKRLGELVAKEMILINGGGRGGMMETKQLATYNAGGHTVGYTFPDLNALVEHPSYDGKGSVTHGLSEVHFTENFAERITAMVSACDIMLIEPGGVGTDTECIAPLLLKKVLPRLYADKPVIIQNLIHPALGERCHDSLIALLKDAGFKEGKDFIVINPPLVFKDKGDQKIHAPLAEAKKRLDNGEKPDMEASMELAAQQTATLLRELIQKKRAATAARSAF